MSFEEHFCPLCFERLIEKQKHNKKWLYCENKNCYYTIKLSDIQQEDDEPDINVIA